MVLSQGTSRDTPCDPRGVAGLWPNGAPEAHAHWAPGASAARPSDMLAASLQALAAQLTF